MSLVHRDPFGIIYIETAFTCKMKNVQTLVNGIWITIPPHVAQLYSRYLLNRGKRRWCSQLQSNYLNCYCKPVALRWRVGCPWLGQNLPTGHLPITRKGVLTPAYARKNPPPPHLISGWLWRLLARYYTASTLHVTQRPFLSLSATFTDLPLLDKAIPCTTTGCSCLASYFRNIKSHVALLNAFAVLLQGI